MKRSLTYVLLISNWVITIGIAIAFFIFLKNSKEQTTPEFLNTLKLSIIPIVVTIVISSVILFIYQYFLNKSLVHMIHQVNPKLLFLIKNTGYITIFNMIIPTIFSITSLSISGVSEETDLLRLILISLGLSFSILIGLCVSGLTSYIFFRVSFNEDRRKALLEGIEPNMKMLQDETIYKNKKIEKKYSNKKPKDLGNVKKTDNSDDDKLATSGTF